MDTTDADIVFDANGMCDHCRTFYTVIKPRWEDDQRDPTRLEKLVSKIKQAGKGRDFDCIIGMSGGADSSYLTLLAVERLGLRPLIFHTDGGWNSQEAVNNIERVLDGLGLDLYTDVIDWAEMRDLQLAFFKSGVSSLDTPQDYAYFAAFYQYAAKHRIPYILTGANHATEAIRNPVNWMYYADSRQLKDIHRRFGMLPLKTFPTTHILFHKLYLPYVRGVRVVRPLNYLPYDKDEAIRELSRRFGWQPYADKHFESRFTKFYEGFWLPERFGYDTRKIKFSNLIITGKMKRAAALEELTKPALDEVTAQREFEYVATKLGISTDELYGYFVMPIKTYRDYKSDRWLYELGAWTMKRLGLEVGGKR